MNSLAGSRPDLDADVLEVIVPVATVWTSPSAPRDLDQPALLDVPDVPAWTESMDAAARRGLVGRTLTQLLLGEQVLVLERQGAWARVAARSQPSAHHPVGYPGWVRTAHLGPPVARRGGPAIVSVPVARLELDDGASMDLSFGSVLAVDEGPRDPSADRVRVRTAGSSGPRSGSLSRTVARVVGPVDALADQSARGGRELLRSAAGFLGLRYLWGGTSAWGLDCSGLVHLVLRAQGVLAPRDAADQAAWAQPVHRDEVRPGDLYFFARPGEPVYHVGIVSAPVGRDGIRRMLHAPEGGELVEDAPLAPHRVQTLVSAGRVPGW